MKTRKIIVGLLALLWMILIFVFSSQTGKESSGLSDTITNFIIKIFYKDYNNFDLSRQQNIYANLSTFVRKSAHACEYGVLSLLVYVFILEKKNIYLIIVPVLFSLLYAISDEIHQIFVNGRVGSIIDVLIDTSGSFVFTMIIFGIHKLINYAKAEK